MDEKKKFPSFSFTPEVASSSKKSHRRKKKEDEETRPDAADRIITEAASQAIENEIQRKQPADNLFVTDTEGDKGNSQYEQNYSYGVPKYNNKSRGTIAAKRQTSTKYRFKAKKGPQKVYGGGEEEDGVVFIEDEEKRAEETTKNTLEGLLKKRSEINRELRGNPQNIDEWYSLYALEQEIQKKSSSTGKTVPIPSIYERALESNPENLRLLRDRAYAEAELGDGKKKLSKTWKELALTHPTESEFWVKWFLEVFNESLGMGVLDILEKLQEDILTALYDIGRKQSESMDHVYAVVVYNIALMYKNTGYGERAVAILQALIEFHFCSPKGNTKPVDSFIQFWDMETRRFGDVGAKKWLNTPVDEPIPKFQGDFLNSEHGEREPVELEYPGRSLDEDSLSDPERVVLSDDILPFLRESNFVSSTTAFSELLFAFISLINPSRSTWKGVDLGETAFPNYTPERYDQKTLEIIRQAVRFDNQKLTPEFISWVFEFTSTVDMDFYSKVSRILLSKDYVRDSKFSLYCKHASIVWQKKGEHETSEAIYSSLTSHSQQSGTLEDRLWAWCSWMVDLLTTTAHDNIDYKKLQNSFPPDSGNSNINYDDPLISFITAYIELFTETDDSSSIHVPVGELLSRYFDKFIKLPSQSLIMVTDVLIYHLWDNFHEDIKLISEHFKNIFVSESSLKYSSITKMKLLDRLVVFQSKANWYPKLPILKPRRPTADIKKVILYFNIKNSGDNHNLIRNFYREAADDDSMNDDPQVWIKYITHELDLQNLSEARKVLFSAVKNCPWNKQLVLLGIENLQPVQSPIDVRQLYQMCQTRQFRFHHNLTELSTNL